MGEWWRRDWARVWGIRAVRVFTVFLVEGPYRPEFCLAVAMPTYPESSNGTPEGAGEDAKRMEEAVVDNLGEGFVDDITQQKEEDIADCD
jgi:hypothetical protein